MQISPQTPGSCSISLTRLGRLAAQLREHHVGRVRRSSCLLDHWHGWHQLTRGDGAVLSWSGTRRGLSPRSARLSKSQGALARFVDLLPNLPVGTVTGTAKAR
jgi:hypothetical protein